MLKGYTFRRLRQEEVPQMFLLILQRIAWMNERGIRQWNVTDYAAVYPESYYAEHCRQGRTFALIDDAAGEVVCAAILLETDQRWKDDAPAFYLHNFVSKVGEHGVGRVFLTHAEEYAATLGKRYFRLDSAVDNAALAHYYESQGYEPVGECEDGLYSGILRQKELVMK